MNDNEHQEPGRARRHGASEQAAFWLLSPIFGGDRCTTRNVSRAPQRALCRLLGFNALLLFAGLVMPAVSQAQFTVTEGKGYVLCERVVAHVNRLTENGKAKRLWPKDDQMPSGSNGSEQSDLIGELLSFPGFKRPAFVEIKLEDIRALIELMGEVNVLGVLSAPHYRNDKNGIAQYLIDRRANQVPPQVLEKIRPHGQWLWDRLLKGKARVFKLAGIDALTSDTILQIEYSDEVTGEPVVLLRVVSNDLVEPRPRASSLDWYRPSRALVQWKDAYYTIHFGGVTSFEIRSRVDSAHPYLCRVDNPYRPSYPKSNRK